MTALHAGNTDVYFHFFHTEHPDTRIDLQWANGVTIKTHRTKLGIAGVVKIMHLAILQSR
jgi:hypothetical protein